MNWKTNNVHTVSHRADYLNPSRWRVNIIF